MDRSLDRFKVIQSAELRARRLDWSWVLYIGALVGVFIAGRLSALDFPTRWGF